MTRLILKILLVFIVFAAGWLAHEHVESNLLPHSVHLQSSAPWTVRSDLVARTRRVEGMSRSHVELLHTLDRMTQSTQTSCASDQHHR